MARAKQNIRRPEAQSIRTWTTGGMRPSLASRMEGQLSMHIGVEPSSGRFRKTS